MSIRIGVVTFPGSLDDGDARRAARIAGAEPVALWHADADLHDVDAVVLPGGFSYGDYLRAGAIARFAPVMDRIVDAASGGLPVLGICNGFQVLCEAHLLPGALVRNDHRTFICRDQPLVIESTATAWTSQYRPGETIVVPLKNGEGGYVADVRTLDELAAEGRIVARYVVDVERGLANPNGSLRGIAGVANERGNVVGLMPHPEHATEPGFGPDGAGVDGLRFFTSVIATVEGMVAA